MARIFFGVQGDGTGHVNRARIIAREMPEHEFIFAGGGNTQNLAAEDYRVIQIPFLDTLYRNNKVDIAATANQAMKVLAERQSTINQISEAIRNYDPHLIITDYEYFTAAASRNLGRFCVSVDHQHVLTHCSSNLPTRHYFNKFITNIIIKTLFSKADYYLIVSFFNLPALNPETTEVLPAIIDGSITEKKPSNENYILVYQTSPTFRRLFTLLRSINCNCVIYGFEDLPSEGNLIFRRRSRENFIKDLASCRYVISNGGHNVISEALYFGKPVLSFPIAGHYEQYINARYVAELGYGDFSLNQDPSRPLIDGFEERIEEFKANIKRKFTSGNHELIRRLDSMIVQNGITTNRKQIAP